MIYALILLAVCAAVYFLIRHRRQREENKPVLEQRTADVQQNTEPEEPAIAFSLEAIASPAFEVDLTNCRILVVDDQAPIRFLLRELFEQEGITVLEASNGVAAVEAVRDQDVHYVLLDLKMPDMDGIEALREIRRMNRSVQVAMITAFGDPDRIDAAKRLGVRTFFTKPFDILYVKSHVINDLRRGLNSPAEVTASLHASS
ncbi:response regulator [Paenibacillus sp. R14(2021)]|uniref:response regulator n=1 Tax=Paenibacillus sp. R14(2021) TaxID=2859228 RepID=UPI001C612A56|nr:response regulator [Paenibacillus sp. R14(2021)]